MKAIYGKDAPQELLASSGIPDIESDVVLYLQRHLCPIPTSPQSDRTRHDLPRPRQIRDETVAVH
ncbi:hypothetical protein SCLCIDRAFT_1225152 [Scleroderma citrinum Foug A]|uniref:Uncharacterized protein n=1 Tax=Scleroderma citrinum Foug A TaxID=1036808 RepID=A0A0C3D2V5_9AGAM|nr:hypothetical protein SCLCIDRAFT_1225152 [Scleroderma citrinum Foug A]